VVPAFNIRLADGRYRIMIEPPLKLVRTGDVSRDILENTARFNTVIEKYVRMTPDNWLWVHRRWRIKEIPEHARKKIKGLPAYPMALPRKVKPAASTANPIDAVDIPRRFNRNENCSGNTPKQQDR
jgi:hypothetical protein